MSKHFFSAMFESLVKQSKFGHQLPLTKIRIHSDDQEQQSSANRQQDTLRAVFRDI